MRLATNLRQRLGLRSWAAPDTDPAPVQLACTVEDLSGWRPVLPADDLVGLDQTDEVERSWVRRHVACDYKGNGAIVELGCWLGATTLALCEGLSANETPGRAGARVHVYDRFHFDDQRHTVSDVLGPYEEGASFRDVFDRRVAPVEHLIDVHEGDVTTMAWDPAQPIELLFDDISKTWSTWLAVRRSFYAALVPGSMVVEQDFAHAYTPWLHLSHHRWRPYLDVVGQIPGTTSVVFRVREPLPHGSLWNDDLVEGYSPREVEQAFDWAESIVESGVRDRVRAARVMLYVHQGSLATAAEELFRAVDDGFGHGEVLSAALPALAERWTEMRRERAAQPARTALEWLTGEPLRYGARHLGRLWHAR